MRSFIRPLRSGVLVTAVAWLPLACGDASGHELWSDASGVRRPSNANERQYSDSRRVENRREKRDVDAGPRSGNDAEAETGSESETGSGQGGSSNTGGKVAPEQQPDGNEPGGAHPGNSGVGGSGVPGLSSCSLPLAQEGLALPAWRLAITDEQWEELHRHVHDDIEVTAEVCIEGVAYPVGVEIQGASSRSLPKKNYKLKFNRGPELNGEFFGTELSIDKVIIKAMATDRALIRETLAFELWREMGHDAPRESFLNLQINNRYHGVYVLVEPVDKDYLRRRGIPAWGRLYKGVRKHGSFADFRPGRPLDKAFEDKTTPESADYTLLDELVALIQDESLEGEGFADVVGSQISLVEYVDRMIWVSFTQNGDALRQNFFLYHVDVEDELPWRMIPWDSNLCFGADWRSPESLEPFDSGFHRGGNLFAERVLETPSLRRRFKQRYLELLDTVFEERHLQELFHRFADQVRDDLHWDRARWEYPTDAVTALGAVQEFLEVRPGLAREHLDEFRE